MFNIQFSPNVQKPSALAIHCAALLEIVNQETYNTDRKAHKLNTVNPLQINIDITGIAKWCSCLFRALIVKKVEIIIQQIEMAAKINGRNKGVWPSLLAAKSIIKATLPVPKTKDDIIHFML